MATIFRDGDLKLIQSRRMAILGYGSQGRAHALNLRDSGCRVRLGLRTGGASSPRAREDGFEVCPVAEAAAWADFIVLLVPDTALPALFAAEVAPHLAPGKLLLFAHGFNVHFGTIALRPDIDVAMVAPKAPGPRVREVFVEGGGTPALLAVHQNATGQAHALALAYARALGATRAGVLETTFAEETETDLFGEQAVLCGGVSALVKAGFETLVAAGYQPEVAYFECLHELKLIVDLIYCGGLSGMRAAVSDTAEYGDYTGGPQVVGTATRQAMREMLRRIRDGSFARAWMAETAAGRPNFRETRRREQRQLLEQVGEKLRAEMTFLQAEAPREEMVHGV